MPGFHVAGPAFGVAAGLAFLVAWISNRGRWGLYPGIFVLAISLPGFLIDLGVLRDAPGWTTLFLGIGLLIVAIARWPARRASAGRRSSADCSSWVVATTLPRTLAPNVPSVDAIVFPV